MNEPRNVITKEKKIEGISLKTCIEKEMLLKTKIKLLHILLLDQDLETLKKEKLTLSSLNLEDLFLIEGMHLIAPVAEKIIPFEENNLKLSTYLIYLSYLYNINLITIYDKDPYLLWYLLSNTQISENIKRNFYTLMIDQEGKYFSSFLNELNNHEFRENVKKDRTILQRVSRETFLP